MQCSFTRHPSFARLFRSSPSQKYSFLRCFFNIIFHTTSYYPRSPISLVASGSSVSVLDVDRATSSFQFHDTQKMNQCFHRISSSRLCPYTAHFPFTSPPPLLPLFWSKLLVPLPLTPTMEWQTRRYEVFAPDMTLAPDKSSDKCIEETVGLLLPHVVFRCWLAFLTLPCEYLAGGKAATSLAHPRTHTHT